MKAIKFLMTAAIAVAMATGAWAQDKKATMTLDQARSQISEVVSDPGKMGEVVSALSPADQITFLAEVNAAIETLPASGEEKTAMFIEVNRAALKNAAPGNLGNMVAEVFATVPVNELPAVNETFGTELFNRAADPSRTYTDAQFTDIAKNIVDKVQARTAGGEKSAERNTFAALMMMSASNGTPADLGNALTENFEPAAQNLARNEWIPAATGANQDKTYEPLLGGVETTETVYDNKTAQTSQSSVTVTIRVPTQMTMDAMLADIVSEVGYAGALSSEYTDNLNPKFDDPASTMSRVETMEPVTPGAKMIDENGNEVEPPWGPNSQRGESTPISEDTQVEPTGYKNQTPGGTN